MAGLSLTLLLLAGDVQLNPGPVTAGALQSPGAVPVSAIHSVLPVVSEHEPPESGFSNYNLNLGHGDLMNNLSFLDCGDLDRSTVCPTKSADDSAARCNPAVKRQRLFKTFQTVNHAKVLWDPKLKPRGLFGGQFNIRSITPKSNQLIHLLSDSNMDFLCLTETWLKQSTPSSVFTVPGYQCFRRDRPDGRGGGVLFYVREGIKCEREVYKAGSTLEYVGIKIILSKQMSFNIIGVYRPPSADDTFYDQLAEVLNECNHNKELLLMGDFNVNWEDKSKRKKLKMITEKFHLEQLVKGPTRITKCSSTQIDLILTKRAERITKSYNLITGLSDHNLTLCARKLSKNRFRNTANKTKICKCIPKAKQEEFASEINSLNWDDVLSSDDLNYGCNQGRRFGLNIGGDRFTIHYFAIDAPACC